jgi:hypothetical protein
VTAESALQAFVARDLPRIEGLPEGMTLKEAATTLGADPASFGRWFIGEPQDEVFYTQADVPGYEGGVRIWFRDGVVLQVTGAWPQMDTGALAALGDPDDRLDFRMDTLVVPEGERVYAARGLAVRLNRTEDRVVGLSVFPPTTPARYRDALRPADDYREVAIDDEPWLGEP